MLKKRITIENVRDALICLEAGTNTLEQRINSRNILHDYMMNNCYSEISRSIYLYLVASDEKRYQDTAKIARAIVNFINVLR